MPAATVPFPCEKREGKTNVAPSLSRSPELAVSWSSAIGCFMQAVYITASGGWKLAGFGFALSVEQSLNDGNSGQAFHYPVRASTFSRSCCGIFKTGLL